MSLSPTHLTQQQQYSSSGMVKSSMTTTGTPHISCSLHDTTLSSTGPCLECNALHLASGVLKGSPESNEEGLFARLG